MRTEAEVRMTSSEPYLCHTYSKAITIALWYHQRAVVPCVGAVLSLELRVALTPALQQEQVCMCVCVGGGGAGLCWQQDECRAFISEYLQLWFVWRWLECFP